MLKSILRSKIMQGIFARLVAFYMFLIKTTTKWEIIGLEHAEEIWNSGRGTVNCYWHSRIIMAPSMWPLDKQEYNMLISLSADGQFISRAAELMGLKVIRGSSTKKKHNTIKDKGALKAVRELISAAKAGKAATFTPDGPRGPRMRIQNGVVRVAKSAEVSILPIGLAIKGSKSLNTWDKFVLPPIFSKGVIIYGEPVTATDNEEEARLILEQRLNEITNIADTMCGLALTLPAEIDNIGE